MALFGSDKNSKKSSKKIRPTVVRTQNVAKELVELAKSYEINVNKIDFNILEVQTYTRKNDGAKEVDWEEMSSEDLTELEDKGSFLDKDFQIKQMYEIEIFSKVENDTYADLSLAIGANATKCKVYLSIKEGSSVSYSPRLQRELLILINKSKVRANILINIFDEMMEDVISKIVAHVRVEEKATYNKNQTYLVAEAYEPTLTTDDEIVLHYDKKEEVTESSKIDYSSRDFIQSVHKDELLIEYIKPKEGKAGRNCRGEYMEPKEPVEANVPTFSTDDTIKVVETDDNIEYRAVENGYIVLEGTNYTISSEVDIGEISFKSTGNITAGVDSDINISVKETDEQKDAIGSGMEVEVSEIDIDGNIGAFAKVIALKATVSGQTHKDSIIKADKLEINVHRGAAYGKNIHITRIEHGEVDGDIVEISQAIGGDIRAKEIVIELCSSHVKATASRFIEIKKLQGSENTFTIDPVLKKSKQEDLGENHEEIQKLEADVKSIKSEIDKYGEIIKGNLAIHNDVKKRLLHYKKSGVKMPSSFVKQYKQFTKMQEHLKTIKTEHDVKLDHLKLLTEKTASFQDNIFDARIINRDKWVGYNEIIFKLVDPPIELLHKPAENSTDMVFAVVEVEDGEFKIEAVKE
ncbi:flagellar assembly protein A [Sulfurimonas sp.]|uniref:flagellar assembly protein A n=1 Tax=Sulfurimonas sp. TaxID=2022749 RepID=UPI002AB1E253|nr:flagellar assembly protein A [Sulfurimonas sp.]